MKDTARAAAQLGVTQVNGFTGSSIWHLIYSFPPNDFGEIERGYEEFAERWGPIMDVFDAEGVRFGLEVHPTEIAYDFVTTRRTLDAIGNREAFGINLDPSHFAHQFLDTAQFALEFADRIYHVHVKDSQAPPRRPPLDPRARTSTSARRRAAGTSSHRGTATSTSRSLFRALNRIGYEGPLSIEWEDSGMDRDWGAPDALAFVRRTDFAPSEIAFDAAMQKAGSDEQRHRRAVDRRGRRRRRAEIGVGMLGYAFMGKAHANALPHARLHGVAAAARAAARLDRRARRGSRHRGGEALRLRAVRDRLA